MTLRVWFFFVYVPTVIWQHVGISSQRRDLAEGSRTFCNLSFIYKICSSLYILIGLQTNMLYSKPNQRATPFLRHSVSSIVMQIQWLEPYLKRAINKRISADSLVSNVVRRCLHHCYLPSMITTIYVCCLFICCYLMDRLKRTSTTCRSPLIVWAFVTGYGSIWNTWDTWTTLKVRVLCGPLLLIQWACPSAEQSESLWSYCLQIGPRRPSDAFPVVTVVPLFSLLNNTAPIPAHCAAWVWHHKASNAQFKQGPCRLSLRP